jgi:endoglucanase
MKIAKIITLLICFTLLGGLLSACDNNNQPTETTNPEEVENNAEEIENNAEKIAESVISDFRDLTAEQLMSEMGAGWNLGNTLDAVNRRGAETPWQQETTWGNPATTPEMIQLVADSGFKTLRVPVTWMQFVGDAPDYAIDPAFMDRVEEVVNYGYSLGLYVILNTHHEDDWTFPSYDNYEPAKEKILAIWTQIAKRFEGYSERLIFEGLNEPRLKGQPEEWQGGTDEARDVINKWNVAFVDLIRASGGNNPNRWLMVPTHGASADRAAITGGFGAEVGFIVPNDPINRTIVSVHAYVPYRFALDTRARRANSFDPESDSSTDPIDSMFELLYDNFLSKGIPVVMGETGCLNKENYEARTAWADYYASVSASYGVPMVWWDNGIRLPTWDGEQSFGLMNRRSVEWWYPDIVEAIIRHFS